MIESIIAWVMALLAFIAAVYAVEAKDLLSSAISAGIASLVVSILFLMLHAPDVAITEASIGAGLTMAIFVYSIGRTERWEK
ncbi:MAG TPA: DUF4040 domain-containing protein [Thermoplasmatales archaeon]|jgi:uncharacterized MnhB-related membrane protein|nr:DUF4040 domain-containing protein [Thermoplasmatales archaeon]